MEMKKIACAVLIAASATTVALAADAPAPSPAGVTAAATGAFPAVGAVLGASLVSFFAYYLQ
ncbi:arabinogalactan protein 23-like [Lolium rigidum]|uniref:arabinogalactan protein 23-like n=1 Tax=Lolium rigidum TaxID=89674 RepID=UPI001F5D9B56|nr:arabinogalactan protein 23-like [Lolium rigidum]XP_047068944.1 arabinogalactan protein 23-like [Lolium rigidum]